MSSKSYQHYLDACTEVYMRGGNSDRVSYDRAYDDFYDGRSPEYTAGRVFSEERERRYRVEQQEAEYEQYMQEQYDEYESRQEHLYHQQMPEEFPPEYYETLDKIY